MNAESEVVVSVKRVRACVGQSQELRPLRVRRGRGEVHTCGGKAARMIGARAFCNKSFESLYRIRALPLQITRRDGQGTKKNREGSTG
jgi:hypothetical protein